MYDVLAFARRRRLAKTGTLNVYHESSMNWNSCQILAMYKIFLHISVDLKLIVKRNSNIWIVCTTRQTFCGAPTPNRDETTQQGRVSTLSSCHTVLPQGYSPKSTTTTVYCRGTCRCHRLLVLRRARWISAHRHGSTGNTFLFKITDYFHNNGGWSNWNQHQKAILDLKMRHVSN